jgi:hypothetical protein
MTGWISIHRSIRDHWIWQDPVKLKWWLDILMTVNHKESKVNIGMQLYECQRGQSIMSLQSWAIKWNVSKDVVRNFFELLKKDGMVHTESLIKTTRLTVCNYDSYQIDLHAEPTLEHSNDNATPTDGHPNNNDNNNIPTNVGCENPEDLSHENIRKEKINYKEVVNLFHLVCKSFPKVETLTDARRDKIRIRINELKKQFKDTDYQSVLKELFAKMEASEFLRGNNKNEWKASFDWIFENGKNWVKVYEGNYDHSPVNGKPQPELLTPKLKAI